mgnify:CR=1 FL=1
MHVIVLQVQSESLPQVHITISIAVNVEGLAPAPSLRHAAVDEMAQHGSIVNEPQTAPDGCKGTQDVSVVRGIEVEIVNGGIIGTALRNNSTREESHPVVILPSARPLLR